MHEIEKRLMDAGIRYSQSVDTLEEVVEVNRNAEYVDAEVRAFIPTDALPDSEEIDNTKEYAVFVGAKQR